jgi:hypothetical protein
MPPVALQLPPSPLRRLRSCEAVDLKDSRTSTAVVVYGYNKETRSTSDDPRKEMRTDALSASSSYAASEPLVAGSIPSAPQARSILRVKTQDQSLAKEVPSLHQKAILQRSFPRRRVRFSEIYVRNFPCCLGDNPSIHGGLPLALDYAVEPSVQVEAVNDYERHRKDQRKTNPKDLILSKDDRRLRLDELEYTSWELNVCKRQVRTQQLQRGWTNTTRNLDPVQETLEVAAKAVANATWNRRRNQKEQKWLMAYRVKPMGASMEPVVPIMP